MTTIGQGLADFGAGLGGFLAARKQRNALVDFQSGVNIMDEILAGDIKKPVVQDFMSSHGIVLPDNVTNTDALLAVRDKLTEKYPVLSAKNRQMINAPAMTALQQQHALDGVNTLMQDPNTRSMLTPAELQTVQSIAQIDPEMALKSFTEMHIKKMESLGSGMGTAEGQGRFYESPEGQAIVNEKERRSLQLSMAKTQYSQELADKLARSRIMLSDALARSRQGTADKQAAIGTQLSAVKDFTKTATDTVSDAVKGMDESKKNILTTQDKINKDSFLTTWDNKSVLPGVSNGDMARAYTKFSMEAQTGDKPVSVKRELADYLLKEKNIPLTTDNLKTIDQWADSYNPVDRGTSSELSDEQKSYYADLVGEEANYSHLTSIYREAKGHAQGILDNARSLQQNYEPGSVNYNTLQLTIDAANGALSTQEPQVLPRKGISYQGDTSSILTPEEHISKIEQKVAPKPSPATQKFTESLPKTQATTPEQKINTIEIVKDQNTKTAVDAAVNKIVQSGSPVSPTAALVELKRIIKEKNGRDLTPEEETRFGDAINKWNGGLQ